jgi:serine/threonine-protein kinase
MTATPTCPEPSQWHELLAGAMSAKQQAVLTGHLETCVDCRQTLEDLAAGNAAWADQARRLGSESPVVDSALHRAMAHLRDLPSEAATLVPPLSFDVASLALLGPPDEPGHLGKLGPYVVLEEIGRGGMGIVLKAHDTKLHRFVAIKVLSPRLAADATARQRFLREARAVAAVRHEHVVTIHDVDEASGFPYLVMEYVPGMALQERLEHKPSPDLEEILRLGAETAAGLAAAHARGLVHRDIKPANILLEDGRHVKITDFGLARLAEEATAELAEPVGGIDARLTQVGVVAGSPAYMAPEQARALPLDNRADLFSLGSVLYALCTGQAPFQANTVVAVLHDVAEATPRPIAEINPAIPHWLIAIITRLHAKDPSQRFQSAAEVAELLDHHLAEVRQQARGMHPAWRHPGFEYRSRRLVAGWPLVHIATGLDSRTGRVRVAKGIIAIGNVAVGVLAIGGLAAGGIAIGGGAVGVLALGGGAIALAFACGGGAVGLVALGGIAVGMIALGGGAIGYYALGGGAWGVHTFGGNFQDPEAVQFFRYWLGRFLPGIG